MISQSVVHNALRRILRLRSSSLEAMANRVWEYAPAGTETVAPIILMPGSIERVVSGPTFGPGKPMTRDEIIPDAFGGGRPIAATTVYEIRDALVSHGSVYARGHRYSLIAKPIRQALLGTPEMIDEAVLASSPWGSNFFGHWIMEDCAQQLLAESLGPEIIDIKRPLYKHEPGYRELLELRAPRQVEHALIRKLTVIVDPGPTFDKRRRIAMLRDRLRKNLGTLPAAIRGVYVARGATGVRRSLTNQDVLIARLRERGFSVIEPDKLTSRQVATALASTKLMMGVDGSHIAPHVISLPTGATVIELHAANRFYPAHRLYLNAFGIKYAMLICPHRNEGEFEAKLDELEGLLDLCDFDEAAATATPSAAPG
jgi:capsular polysaccharide biosynthesis protein